MQLLFGHYLTSLDLSLWSKKIEGYCLRENQLNRLRERILCRLILMTLLVFSGRPHGLFATLLESNSRLISPSTFWRLLLATRSLLLGSVPIFLRIVGTAPKAMVLLVCAIRLAFQRCLQNLLEFFRKILATVSDPRFQCGWLLL